MNDDELRRALGSYASWAPRSDPRPGLSARLARRARARRAGVAGVAALGVAAGGLVALDRDPRRDVVAQDPTPSATPPLPPRAGPAPVVATGTGRDGLRVRVTLDPGDPATATEAALRVEAEDDVVGEFVVEVDWGDGSRSELSGFGAASCAVPTGPPARDPRTLRETFSHAWRHPGPAKVVVTVGSVLPCHTGDWREEAVVTLPADVRPGLVTSNGPDEPDAAGTRAYVPPNGVVRLDVKAFDRDGYIDGVEIDWGDGISAGVHQKGDCDDGDGAHFPKGDLRSTVDHRYDAPGTYRIVVRFDSTGCELRDPQRAETVLTVHVPS